MDLGPGSPVPPGQGGGASQPPLGGDPYGAYGGGAAAQVWATHRIADPTQRPRELGAASSFAVAGLVLVGLANLGRLATAVSLYGGADTANVLGLSSLPGLRHDFAVWEGIGTVAYLLCAAMFIPWFAMAYGNLRRLGVQHMRWSNGWAVGWWFVPIMNLFRPKQMANDVWRGSEQGADVGSERWRLLPVSPVVHWWWGLYLAGGAVAGIGSALASAGYSDLVRASQLGLERGSDLAKIRSGSIVAVIGFAALIAAVVLAAMFVRRSTERLESIRHHVILTEPVQAAVQTSPPPQDLAPCPECAELVLPFGFCRYCGYSFAGPAGR
jgi:hypothetical protein